MEITVTNHIGQTLTLDMLNFPVIAVEGITPCSSTINTSTVATTDGSYFNSSKINQRNIVLTIVPNATDIGKARLELYKYFKPKRKCTLNFKTKHRNVKIDGYVETFEGGLYSAKQAFQISVICPRAFFEDVETVNVKQTAVYDAFEFPFETTEEGIELSTLNSLADVNVVNIGEESTGLTIELLATGTVLEPTIYNKTKNEKMTIKVELKRGDIIEIDTRQGQKRIALISDGIQTNIINKIEKGSNWIGLEIGENIFTYSAVYGLENLIATYSFNPLYEGV